MAKEKAKKERKSSGKRNVTPKLQCDVDVDCRTPHTTESSGRLATALTTLMEKEAEWKDSGESWPICHGFLSERVSRVLRSERGGDGASLGGDSNT